MGLAVGWVGSKINGKAAWNKFSKEPYVSYVVIEGGTLYSQHTSKETSGQLAGSKYAKLGTAVCLLQYSLTETYTIVLDKRLISINMLTKINARIDQIAWQYCDVPVAYYRMGHDSYTRCMAAWEKRNEEEGIAAKTVKEAAKGGLLVVRDMGEENRVLVEVQRFSAVYRGMDSAAVMMLYGSI
ncbi:hypothetical protein [Chitinophaga rhizophila]|uniref:Uncharacterized protein n=1 Tax=Chitinophaga rhizophila TaxID=2866212 RepID=A0ABS7GKR9_9BACT|nr:hypothetical protein [Chitinophaga rhizophila]MBW8688332.1 hypothetical protein [Chitinophaga rhizophila]